MPFCMTCSRDYFGTYCPTCKRIAPLYGKGLQEPPRPSQGQLVEAWLREEQEGVRWSRAFWSDSAYTQILGHLQTRRWSQIRFENLVTYGSAEQIRHLAAGGMFFGDPLEWDLGTGVCGMTANQLAKALLGRDEGQALVGAANGVQNQDDHDHLATVDGITVGCGLDSLQEALSTSSRRIAIVNFRPNHRLLLEKGPCSAVELLQSWYNPMPGHGYTLARWLISADYRVRHTVNGFITLLRQALEGEPGLRAAANLELFAPVGSNFNEMLDQGLRPTFAIRDVEAFQLTTSLTNFCNTPASIFD